MRAIERGEAERRIVPVLLVEGVETETNETRVGLPKTVTDGSPVHICAAMSRLSPFIKAACFDRPDAREPCQMRGPGGAPPGRLVFHGIAFISAARVAPQFLMSLHVSSAQQIGR